MSFELAEHGPSPQLVKYCQQIDVFKSEIEALSAVESFDILMAQVERYQSLVKAISDMAARREIFVSLQIPTLEQAVGFRESLLQLFLVSTKLPPRPSTKMNFDYARWQSREIIQPLEARSLIVKFGLKSGVIPNLHTAAKELGFNSPNSVTRRVTEGIFKLTQPKNLKILQAGIAGETY